MNPDDLAIGWRAALLGAVVLLVVYVLVVVFRLRRLRRKAGGELPDARPEPPPAPADGAAPPAPLAVQVAAAYAKPDFPWNEPPDAPSAGDRLAALEVELNGLRSELATLQGELSSLSGEVSVVRNQLQRDIERVGEQVQASQHVAPIYGDAMQMALAGHDAAAIAECCGVARAEAELVVALIRNREGEAADDPQTPTMRER